MKKVNKNKVITSLCIIVILATMMSGCGKSEKKAESVDTSTIMNLLEETSKSCDEVTDLVLTSWDVVGPERILPCLDVMKEITSKDILDDVIYHNYLTGRGVYDTDIHKVAYKMGFATIIGNSPKIFFDEDKEGFCNVCKNYSNNCNKISENLKELESEIKAIKSVDEETFSHIKDYYLKIQSYAGIALEPSGNLADYSDKVNEFKQNIKDLKQKAELEL